MRAFSMSLKSGQRGWNSTVPLLRARPGWLPLDRFKRNSGGASLTHGTSELAIERLPANAADHSDDLVLSHTEFFQIPSKVAYQPRPRFRAHALPITREAVGGAGRRGNGAAVPNARRNQPRPAPTIDSRQRRA